MEGRAERKTFLESQSHSKFKEEVREVSCLERDLPRIQTKFKEDVREVSLWGGYDS